MEDDFAIIRKKVYFDRKLWNVGSDGGEMNKKYIAYVSAYTHGKSKGILICDVDVKQGHFTPRSEIVIHNPSYMAKSHSGKYLYSICDEGLVAYRILENGNLGFINQGSINGMRACYLTVDLKDKYIFCAGYHDGKATIVRIREDGGIGEVTDEVFHKGLGSVAERNFRPHVSCAVLTPDQKYMVACDLGTDQAEVYRFDPITGKIRLVDVIRCELESAPRTMVFSPDGKFAYLSHELKNYVAIYSYRDNGRLPEFELIDRISTLGQDSYKKNSAAVAIKFSPDGKNLFVSNAGDNSVAIYDRDEETGRLTMRSVLPISGDYPKDIAIFPDGKHLVSMNHETNEMTFFEINYEKGILVMHGKPEAIETPNCCIIAEI